MPEITPTRSAYRLDFTLTLGDDGIDQLPGWPGTPGTDDGPQSGVEVLIEGLLREMAAAGRNYLDGLGLCMDDDLDPTLGPSTFHVDRTLTALLNKIEPTTYTTEGNHDHD